MCDHEHFAALEARMDKTEDRLIKVETDLAGTRKVVEDGFKQLSTAINTLGHDFGDRMNLIEKKVVDEKSEWGKVLRKVVLWSAATLLSGAAVAMGVTIWKNFVIK